MAAPAPAERPATLQRHLAGLHGLRGLAALAVLVDHVGQHAPAGVPSGLVRAMNLGGQGLTIFFALSGFLLFRPFAVALLTGRPLPSLRRYLVNRLLRIYPAYWVIYVVVLVSGLAFTAAQASAPAAERAPGFITDPLTIIADLLLVQTLIPSTLLTGIGPAWSLTTELTFYAALPLLAHVAARLSRRSGRVVAAAAPVVFMVLVGGVTSAALVAATRGMSPGERLAFSWGPSWTAVLDRSLLAQAALFGFGMAGALLVELIGRRGSRRASLRTRAVVVSAAVAVGVFGGAAGGYAGVTLVGLAASATITVVAMPLRDGTSGLLARALDLPAVRRLGTVSYSVYLWHVPVLLGVLSATPQANGVGGLMMRLLLVIVITLALSALSYACVESQALRIRDRIDRHHAPGRRRPLRIRTH